MRPQTLALLAVLGICAAPRLGGAAEPERPNFVFFITDDISWDDLGCYGHPTLKTPHLDRVARDGIVFESCYLVASSCSPSRCSIITGRYPHNHGAPELHTALPEGQYLFPLALKEAGYYTVLSGKHHMGSNADQAFSHISKGRGPGKEADWVEILRERPEDRPFFCWFASVDAHRGWAINDEAPTYDPKDVVVPPYLYDGFKTREDLTGYYHEISRTDTYAGRIVDELRRQKIAERTYFIYCSDNGRPFPRCKTRLYDSGIKSPLIVWRPGTVKPGRSQALVSSIDFGPTILELAGVSGDPRIQGVSFAKLLEDPSSSVRDFVFAEHNWHVYQSHERMVRYRSWVYIRNAWPERQNLCVESDPTFPAGEELWMAHEEGRLKPSQMDVFLKPRPAEELYDVASDPDQLSNLANRDEHRAMLEKLRGVLDSWSEETADSIPDRPTPDRQSPQGKRNPDWRRGDFPGADRKAETVQRSGPVREKDIEG